VGTMIRPCDELIEIVIGPVLVSALWTRLTKIAESINGNKMRMISFLSPF
jgi:hypothetical protein